MDFRFHPVQKLKLAGLIMYSIIGIAGNNNVSIRLRDSSIKKQSLTHTIFLAHKTAPFVRFDYLSIHIETMREEHRRLENNFAGAL